MELLTERYAEDIAGVLSCFDRVVIAGTLPSWCYANGMALSACREPDQAQHRVQPDNAFSAMGDFSQAHALNDSFEMESLHKKLDSFAET